MPRPGLSNWCGPPIENFSSDSPLFNSLGTEIDFIFHLASAVGVKNIMDNPLGSIENIINGTKRMLDVATIKNAQILITSTSEVYGKSDEIPFKEDGDVQYGPTSNYRWSYAYAKALDEMMALGYRKQHNTKVNIVRLFNTVGPRQSPDYGMVLPRFVDAALKQQPLTVYGSGYQTRCFGHVKDVVKALYTISNEPKCEGEIINIGSNEEITIRELAEKVLRIASSNSHIIHVNPKTVYTEGFEDMHRRVPSIEKVYTLTGWEPSYTLEEIIRDTIQYRKTVLKLD